MMESLTMKTLTKGVLVCLCLTYQMAHAELELLDDSHMSDLTGQSGLTIDIDMGVEIGEFMYKDGGSIVMQGIRVGGKDHTTEVGTSFDASVGIVVDPLDPGKGNTFGYTGNYGGTTGLNNVRIDVDVAGAGEQFGLAWSDIFGTIQPFSCIPCIYNAGDGDLIISATASDPNLSALTEFEDPLAGTSLTIGDFGLEMDKFALKDSTYGPGSDLGVGSVAQETTIISNFRMEGYYGGFDLIIENNGNGFTNGIADSKIKINTFFKVTEMEYDFNIAGIRYEKMRIHNTRRNQWITFDLDQNDVAPGFPTSTISQSFAQAGTHIYAVKDSVLNLATLTSQTGNNPVAYVDGIAMDSRFFGDMDIGHLSFGDTGTSIGELYWTDWDIDTNRVISAH